MVRVALLQCHFPALHKLKLPLVLISPVLKSPDWLVCPIPRACWTEPVKLALKDVNMKLTGTDNVHLISWFTLLEPFF
jgi:hypothetical protein